MCFVLCWERGSMALILLLFCDQDLQRAESKSGGGGLLQNKMQAVHREDSSMSCSRGW